MSAADSSRSGRAGGGRASHRFRAERARTGLVKDLVEESVAGTPWLPHALRESPRAPRPADGSYVVIDEVIDSTATLRVTPWPVIDDRGRLRFPNRKAGFTTSVSTQVLRRQVDRSRDVRRPIRVGDVFLLVADVETARQAGPNKLISWDMIDVTPAARDAVKAQYFAAVAPVLDEDDVLRLYRDLAADAEPPQDLR